MDSSNISAKHGGASNIKPKQPKGPFTPQLILHGGAGAVTRERLPPDLYQRYRRSLLSYLTSTNALLTEVDDPASALDAACHAVSLMEDDPLFNCGRGSVFNVNGKIEMEASVAVTSVASGENHGGRSIPPPGSIKRSAAVSMVRNTRHPIQLAREVLLMADEDGGLGGTAEMHGHLSGRDVEEWGWKEKGLEKKPDDWFWTKWRWEEHRRGLGKEIEDAVVSHVAEVASQGTVGCVCLDSWGNLAVATSTGGLTNKRSGRIGDTPTAGAGFYAESWVENTSEATVFSSAANDVLQAGLWDLLGGLQAVSRRSWLARCLMPSEEPVPLRSQEKPSQHQSLLSYECNDSEKKSKSTRRRAVAMSGTGNGDSFLRASAARTTAAMCRFSGQSLAEATAAVAGPGGELQQSAGDRWGRTGEGEGGIIAIEAIHSKGVHEANIVFDFNCGGMWRAWYDEGKPRVMVFKDEY